jgi:glycosyltransferase involved in cell wall biosynthesis
MGSRTEIILVEGNSLDQTLEECYAVQKKFPEKEIQVLVQDGIGKADAVRKGCQVAKGEALVLFDADLTVAPEEISRMVEALVKGEGDLVIGNRFAHPMERRAMPWINYLGNQIFSRIFTLLIGKPIRDTLCGAKALWKDDYHRIDSHRKEMGSCDPFGDFDLLLGAKRWNLKILEIPVRYRARRYGDSKIHRFRHGAMLLKTMVRTSMRLASSASLESIDCHPQG